MTMRTLGNEKGVSLIMTVATLLILSLMAVVIISLVGTETFSALNETQSLQTFDLAEAGAHRAITYLGLEAGDCTAITGASQFTNVAMGRGTFTVTATHYNPTSTTLSSNIDALPTTTTIPVGSTTDFAPHGRIHIRFPAPQVDAVKTATSSSSPMTISHTVSGTDRLLVVGISQGNVNAPVATITYGGTPLTALGTESGGPPRIEMWRLLDPPVGTADVVVTFSGTPSDGAVVGVMSLTNVNQTTPFGPFVSNAGNGTASVDVTSEEGELVIDVIAKDNAVAPAVGAGQTERWNKAFSNSAYGALSTRPGAKTVTMAWWSANDWAIGAVSLKPLDPESTDYTDKTANSFTGALRGVNGTTANSHLAGAVVTQDQCLITSTGTIPGPSGPAKRVVAVGVEYP
ncbi:MAG: hypothetical protein ACE5JQ_08985 [Candidatus Methylomirabilales bacterium]